MLPWQSKVRDHCPGAWRATPQYFLQQHMSCIHIVHPSSSVISVATKCQKQKYICVSRLFHTLSFLCLFVVFSTSVQKVSLLTLRNLKMNRDFLIWPFCQASNLNILMHQSLTVSLTEVKFLSLGRFDTYMDAYQNLSHQVYIFYVNEHC